MTSHVQPEQTVCLKSLPKSKLDSTTVQGGDLSDEPVEDLSPGFVCPRLVRYADTRGGYWCHAVPDRAHCTG